MAILSNLLVRIGVDDDKVRAGVDRIGRQFDRLNSSIEKLGKPTALAALAGSAVHLGSALAPAVGILAAVPGAALGAAAAMTTFKLAIDGVGDALGTAVEGDTKKFTEALQEMPPAARSVVKELGGALFNLRDRVQNEFFKPMVAGTRGLAKQMRGPLSSAMGTIASSMGRFGAQLVAVAREGKSLSFLRSLARAVSAGIRGAASGIGPLVRGIRDFAAAGLGVFGRTGQALGRLMTQAGQWLSRMAKSGKATQWINNAVESLKQLGRIGRNVALIIGGIFASAGGAGDLLTGIEQITSKLAEWVNSAEGQQQLGTIFAMLKDIASSLAVILPVVAGALSMIAGIIQSLPAPAREAVAQFLAWSLIIGVVTSRFGPLIKAIGLVGESAAKVGGGAAKGFSKLTTALRSPESGLRRFAGQVAQAGAAMGRMAGAGARVVGRVASSAGTVAARFAKAAGNMGKAAGTAAGRVAAAGGHMVASMAKASARVVAMWVKMAAKALIQAARMAVSWIIAMGPIGWVITAVVALVALIVANWDKIKEATKAAWEWVGNKINSVWEWIKGRATAFKDWLGRLFTNFSPTRNFAAAWEWMRNAAINHVTSLTNWLRGLPNRILSAIGNLGNLLYNTGRNVVIGLWNGIAAAGSWLANQLWRWVKAVIPDPIERFLGIRSPSRLMAGIGGDVAAGLALGITDGAGVVSKAAEELAAQAVPDMSAAQYQAPSAYGAATPSGVHAAAAGQAPTLVIQSDGTRVGDLLVEVLRQAVRVRGGNVQTVLGRA